MRQPKPRYHHGDLRNALVEQAVKLVEEAGAESFSLREAARRVGVSANAAYRHFADKSDLLAAVAEVGFARMERRMLRAIAAAARRPTAPATAVERLKAAGRAYVEFAVEHPELLRVMSGSSGLAPREERGPGRPAPLALLGKALDDLVSEGVLPAARRARAELKAWTAVHGFATLVVQGVEALQKKAPRTEALESILDFAIVGLCGRLEPPARSSGRARSGPGLAADPVQARRR
jgi:AcrR family transcriptional regulator